MSTVLQLQFICCCCRLSRRIAAAAAVPESESKGRKGGKEERLLKKTKNTVCVNLWQTAEINVGRKKGGEGEKRAGIRPTNEYKVQSTGMKKGSSSSSVGKQAGSSGSVGKC